MLVRVPGHQNKLMMFECLAPYIRYDSSDGLNFKFPMFIVAIIVVIVYQMYKKKKDVMSVKEDDGNLVKAFSKKKPLSSQAKKDLNEIERMMKEMGSFSENLKGMVDGAR